MGVNGAASLVHGGSSSPGRTRDALNPRWALMGLLRLYMEVVPRPVGPAMRFRSRPTVIKLLEAIENLSEYQHGKREHSTKQGNLTMCWQKSGE